MCGIVGIVGHSNVNQDIYDALTVLQHRGQDAAGIATCDGYELSLRKDNGLVRDVFHTRHMLALPGRIGIGQLSHFQKENRIGQCMVSNASNLRRYQPGSQ